MVTDPYVYYQSVQPTQQAMAFVSSQLRRYLLKRCFFMFVTLWGVTLIVFAITQLIPGDAAVMVLGTHATEESLEAMRQQLGLHRPWYVQYFDWLFGILQGDFGESMVHQQPIEEVVAPALVRSLELALLSLLLVILFGIPLGVLAAVKRESNTDFAISSVTYFGVSVPEFVSGSLLILLIGGPLFNVFPSGGYVPRSESYIEWLHHLLLPAITLTIVLTAHIMRQTRSGMVEELQSDYVRTARLKGMGEMSVLFKHTLRNGLLPTITVLAIHLGYLMGGIVIVEEVYSYPGVGRQVIFAIENRDLPLLQILVLAIAAVYTIANFTADMLYTYLDPRIEYGD